MPDTIIPTKLFKPLTRPALVPRSRLFNQLNNGLHRTLTLISAPAGFGKTTLVADWICSMGSVQRSLEIPQVAWLSLDEGDNNLKQFMTYFFKSITRLDSNQMLEDTLLEMLQTPNLSPVETILTPLISSLSTTEQKIIFVLDDYHLIETLQIHRALNFWLEYVPPQIHTVVITREDPPFPLARLRARNQLTELRVADLRFAESETTQFLNGIMGLHLDKRSISQLEERTEGWAAGLQMAALSIRERKDVQEFIDNFSGTNRYILDYLLEEVLANQPPEIQRFLLKTSILKQLSAPLCDVLLSENNDSASILSYLEQANLFLLPLDDKRIWYRYHHLFADLLHARLQQTHSKDDLADLHSLAAAWHEQNNIPYGAIYHASLIPDHQWVEKLIDQNYMEIFQKGDSSAIRYWTGELGQELIFKRPKLAIHEANSRAWFGQLDEADQLLKEAEKRLNAQPPSPEIQAMFGYLAYVRSRITAMRGDFEQAIQLCLKAREKTPASNQGLLGGIGVMLGYGYFLNGDFADAIRTLQETILVGKNTGAMNTTIGAYCVLARLYAIQGQLQKSHALYREAQDFIQRSNDQHRGALSIVNVGFAEILYEWNQLENAQTHIEQGLKSIHFWSKADDISMAHCIYAQIQQVQGNSSAAKSNIEKAAQIIQSNGVFPEAHNTVKSAEIMLKMKQEDHYAVSRWASSFDLSGSQDMFRFENELTLITLAKVKFAQGEFEESIEILSQLQASAQAGGRQGRLIKILILQAFLMLKKGNQAQSLSYLEKALALAEPEGYVRIFLDEGRPMQDLLTRWLSTAENSHLKTYASHLVSQFLPEISASEQALSMDTLIEPLSPREIEVLDLIALGKTNKEISQELFVSPGTVKAHTSNIYRKLNVANRTEAVARARELDILS